VFGGAAQTKVYATRLKSMPLDALRYLNESKFNSGDD